MPLLNVRELFGKITGRNDLLAETSYFKNADFFLNEAQRLLDKKFDTPKQFARRSIEFSIGGFFAHIKDLRVVREVWFATNDGRSQLSRRLPDELLADYPNAFTDISTDLSHGIRSLADNVGTAEFWTPIVIGLAPEQNDPNINQFHYDADGILPGDHYKYKGIMVFPASSTAGTLSLVGKFYSPALEADTDKSYWTEVEPMVLVWAAAYLVETSYRNTEGANDWWRQVTNHMFGTDDDLAEEDSGAVNDLEEVT